MQDPISKITKAKRAGSMAQVVEHLTKKKKKQKEPQANKVTL
jgi:hypothetical protein